MSESTPAAVVPVPARTARSEAAGISDSVEVRQPEKPLALQKPTRNLTPTALW